MKVLLTFSLTLSLIASLIFVINNEWEIATYFLLFSFMHMWVLDKKDA